MDKKVTFVIGGMTRGGAERVISILANKYANKGWSVDIIMLLINDVEYNIDKNINIIDMTFSSKSRFKSVPLWLKSFRNYVKNENPDVIVSFVARINLIVLLATYGLNKKIIISERNDPKNDGRSKFIDVATKIFYGKAAKIVFQTKRALNHFPEKLQKKSVIIPNPISIETNTKNCKLHKIVSVGRLSEQKNQIMLIDAFKEVSKQFPEYQLFIYGEGNLRSYLESHIIKNNLEKKVFLPGNISNIHEQISDAEMFVLSSNYEGLSNALLEAMMMGLPCISTNCSGSDEYIINEENGLLVPIGDTQELCLAMSKLIRNDELRELLSEKGIESVKKTDVNNVMKQWELVIEN